MKYPIAAALAATLALVSLPGQAEAGVIFQFSGEITSSSDPSLQHQTVTGTVSFDDPSPPDYTFSSPGSYEENIYLSPTPGSLVVTFSVGGTGYTNASSLDGNVSVTDYDPSLYDFDFTEVHASSSENSYSYLDLYFNQGTAVTTGAMLTNYPSNAIYPQAQSLFHYQDGDGTGLSFDGQIDSVSSAAIVVPEPATLISAGMAGLLGLGYAWKRRRANFAA